MIKLNTPYHVAEENATVNFVEVKNGAITGTYSNGTLTGTLEGNVLSATFHNTAVNAVGLIELTFNENGFEGKWKSGLEPGPMRGKWMGSIVNSKVETNDNESNDSAELTDDQKKYIDEGIWWRDFEDEEEGKIKRSWLMNKTFLLEALKGYGSIIQYAPDNFKNDKNIILVAIKNDGQVLELLSDEFKNDKEVVLEALKNNGCALQFASEEMKSDREMVLEAVKNSADSLEYVSDNLRADRDVILAGVKNSGRAIEYAADSLKYDVAIVMEAVKQDGTSIEFVPNDFSEYAEAVCLAIENDKSSLTYIRNEAILNGLAANGSVGSRKVDFKIRDLISASERYFTDCISKIDDSADDWNDEVERISKVWFDFNQTIYNNHKMDGAALLGLAQVQFNEYRPIPSDGREVEEYTRDLLNEAIELNDECLGDIISYGLRPEEYLDFSDLSEKACTLYWSKSEKTYADAVFTLGTDDDEYELRAGISKEFAKKIVAEAMEVDSGDEDDKEIFESFVSEVGL